MDKVTIHISANEQLLTSAECPLKVASNTVSYIEAVFELGENWTGYDSVRAVWSTYMDTIATVLDSEGKCVVPHEVMTRTQKVFVNLVGSVVENDELTDRLTTYPILAVVVNADALVEGTETALITPSQFEQFVAEVSEEVARVKDIVSTTLNDDYTLTFVFSDGTETTVGPIRGEQGPQGETGPQGPEGPPGEVTLATLESLMPTDTASGAIASFPDGQNVFPLKSCVVQINPIQDTSGGDPSPSNICPISGTDEVGVVDCGKNLFDEHVLVSLCSAVKQNDGSYYIQNLKSAYNKKIFTNPTRYNGQFALTFIRKQTSNGLGLRFKVYYTDGTYGQIGNNIASADVTETYTLVTTSSKTVDYIIGDYGSNISVYFNLQIEKGNTATSYEPYNGNTHTTTLPSTVYGGTIDVVSGVLTVDRAILTLNGQWLGGNFTESTNTARIYYSNTLITDMKPNATTTCEILCDKLKAYAPDYIYSNDVMGISENKNVNANGLWLRIDKTMLSEISREGIQSWLQSNPINVCYKLADAYKQTIQLTPTQVQTLLGTNNIFSTSGDVSVVYVADIQGYVDKQ